MIGDEGQFSPPNRARRVGTAPIVVAVICVLVVIPILLAVVTRLTTGSLSTDHFKTTYCVLNPAHTEVQWAGTLAANAQYLPTEVAVHVNDQSGALVGSAYAQVPFARVKDQRTPVGPVSVRLIGTPRAVECSIALPSGRR